MKINITQELKQMDGTPLIQATARCPQCGQATEARAFTLRQVAVDALMAVQRGEEMAGDEKVRRYALAMQLHNEDEPDLKVEDIALIKERVGELYGPLIVGQVWAMLDPTE